MHRDPQHWHQPEAFLPDRWMALLEDKPAMAELSNMGSNGMYLPFGAGPRNCIGTGAFLSVQRCFASCVRETCRHNEQRKLRFAGSEIGRTALE